MDLPIELQIKVIKSLIEESCYDGFKSICSSNAHFKNICETHLTVFQPELNKCVFRSRLTQLGFDPKSIGPKLIDYAANKISKSNRVHLLTSLKVLKQNNFPFVKGDTYIFLSNIIQMDLEERKIFVEFLINLLKNIQRFTPFILQISDLPLGLSKKQYLLALSCNLIGINKVLEKIILNPDLDLSEPFLEFFVKNLKFSISRYIQDLDLMITGLREEIEMIFNPEDQQVMEEEYAPIIQKLENRMRLIQQHATHNN